MKNTMEKNQIILGIDTTTNICSVALWDRTRMFEDVIETARAHSKSLLPMIQDVLTRAGVDISDVQGIACTRGPGSFTGVRIGIGVAKGIAFGRDIPILPISPLQAIAYRTIRSENPARLTAMMDARMGELYVADYKNIDGIPVLDGHERLAHLDEVAIDEQLIAGTGMQEYKSQIVERGGQLSSVVFPHAADVVELAQKLVVETVSAADFAPVYLRNKVTY